MRFYVGVTDNSWFQFLEESNPPEVNFWKPSGKAFSALQPNELFLFKLHSPYNYITGGGLFKRYTTLPLSFAWDAFGETNGVKSKQELLQKIQAKRRDGERDPVIGCIILVNPFFFPRDMWIPVPSGWAPNIVSGMRYSTDDTHGRYLWDSVLERISNLSIAGQSAAQVSEPVSTYASEVRFRLYLAKARLGQGAFRIEVLEEYKRRCAITGERTVPVLEAAHIKPVSDNGPYDIQNGLLLRSDFHHLFDSGLCTVTDEYRILVSPRIREEYENGREYYAYHEKPLLVMPEKETLKPAPEFLEWHRHNRYRG